MEQKEVRALLEQVSSGELDIDEAMLKLKEAPFEDLGFAKPDYHRALRQGIGEVIYGAGKTPEQIHDIVASMVQQGQKSILITRMSSEAAEAVEQDFIIKYDKYRSRMESVRSLWRLPERVICRWQRKLHRQQSVSEMKSYVCMM